MSPISAVTVAARRGIVVQTALIKCPRVAFSHVTGVRVTQWSAGLGVAAVMIKATSRYESTARLTVGHGPETRLLDYVTIAPAGCVAHTGAGARPIIKCHETCNETL